MAKTLLIRHLPVSLSFQDKEKLLKHFNAEKVWETKSKRNYIFASFSSADQAKSALIRLHQLEIAKRRLVVEYSNENEPLKQANNEDKSSSVSTKQIQEFLRLLNAWNPSVNFYQPPPVNVKYKYPEVTPMTLINMIYELVNNKALYTQTLHLMNKMSLPTPFEDNDRAMNYFKQTFMDFFMDEINIRLPESDEESEMSSDDNQEAKQTVTSLIKRQHTLPKTRKRAAAVLSTATLPAAKKKSSTVQEEVFENTQIQETKKISVIVHQDALAKQLETESQPVGQLGKFEKKEEEKIDKEPQPEIEQPTITKKELLKNRISYSDMKILPVFKNYHPGQPSMRLYIKNLAKTVTEQDMKRIYRRYIENLPEEQAEAFDLRLMQEGRMKGQCFITFPSEQIADKALNETNGYMLKEKPMVVQFARAANKKPID